MFTSVTVVLIILVTGYVLKSIIKPKNYPPGPSWYPLFGSSYVVENMSKKYGAQWKGLSKLAKQYSTKVLGLKLGRELLVVVFGEKNVHQVFTQKEFEGRPDSFFLRLRCLGKRLGITFTDGPLWKEHRQFTLKHLKNVGFGKTLMEKEIQSEMFTILEYIDRKKRKSINVKEVLPLAVMNVLWRFVAGEKIKEDRLRSLLEILNLRSRAFSMAGGWLNQMPWSRFVIPQLSGYALIAKMNQQISDIIEEAIKKHKSNAVEGTDFIYSFLTEIDENKETYTEEQLKTICLDLLIAGSQTTSNVVEFAILAALRNQAAQQKVYEEITNTLGDDIPCWSDSYRLTYTSAFLLEVQRYFTIVPLAGPRRVLEDTQIDGYLIPKDTTVLISVADLHFDTEIWDNPHEFNPERFIDETGVLKNSEHMYHFGLGRRRCPGDSLAKSFIFITFVGILQKYRIDCSNGVLPSDEPSVGLIAAAKPFTVDFVPRNPMVS
ncbi:probable cytochrome P450 305a1 isoform X1 [Plodia interpunctella]|uniref:probable cytochrome P450 305a1 isoform X1 n=2 Tax=Plodia interpunctella TaxID=58824 RepID=UPI0023683611|nr:probable cytochrome P450 305a1 isoform X1 [Plodia interpunctella]